MKPKLRRFLKRLVTGVVAILLLIVVAVGIWVVYFSDYLVIKEIQVKGNEILSSEQITEVAQIPMGLQLARLDINKAAQEIANLKPVASVTIKRNWPNTVTISIIERKPILAVATSQGFLNIDKEGVGFNFTKNLAGGIRVIESKKPSEPLIKEITKAWLAFPEEIKDKVQKVQAETLDDITFILSDKVRVIWGSSDKSEQKAQVFKALYKVEASLYDVSAPDHPVTK